MPTDASASVIVGNSIMVSVWPGGWSSGACANATIAYVSGHAGHPSLRRCQTMYSAYSSSGASGSPVGFQPEIASPSARLRAPAPARDRAFRLRQPHRFDAESGVHVGDGDAVDALHPDRGVRAVEQDRRLDVVVLLLLPLVLQRGDHGERRDRAPRLDLDLVASVVGTTHSGQ